MIPQLEPGLLDRLIDEGERLWDDFKRERGPLFHPFVATDYRAAARALAQLRFRADSFLELGSGVGVVTVLATLLGYDACGIEIDPALVASSERLADSFDANCTFACGTYVPTEYGSHPGLESADFLIITDGPDAYRELGMDLADFDLVYAFPWPDEEPLLFDMVRRCGDDHTVFLTYHGTDGFQYHERAGRGATVGID